MRQESDAVVSTDADLTGAGGPISYGFSRRENDRRGAYFVKKLLAAERCSSRPTR
jgi:hypothetical protein